MKIKASKTNYSGVTISDFIEKTVGNKNFSAADMLGGLLQTVQNMFAEQGLEKLRDEVIGYMEQQVKEEIRGEIIEEVNTYFDTLKNKLETHSHKENLTFKDKREIQGQLNKISSFILDNIDKLNKKIDKKSDAGHDHEIDDINGLSNILDKKLESVEDIKTDIVKKENENKKEIEKIKKDVDTKADKDHKHNEYATKEDFNLLAQRPTHISGGARINDGETNENSTWSGKKISDEIAAGGSASSFLDLTDTPSDYTDDAGKGVRVNAGADGLEFYEIAGGTDEKVKLSATDATAGYLDAKLQEGVQAIQLDLTPTGTTPQAGLMQWNATDGTFDMGLLNGSTLQAGQELYFYGKASGNIANGELCQFAGVQGDHILMKKAVAAEIIAAPHYLIGVATQNITNGNYGYVTRFGKVNGVYTKTPANNDDADWVNGDILYFNNTTGQLTKTAPNAPERDITVAAVIKVQTGSAENGIILVRPQLGKKISDLEDVDGTALTTTGQILVWNQTAGYRDPNYNITNYALTSSVPTSIDNLSDVDVASKAVGDSLVWNGANWVASVAATSVNNATELYLDTTASVADNYTLSTSPSSFAETINTKAVTSATQPVFLERFISGPIGSDTIQGGRWIFNIYGATSNSAGNNYIKFRINKRVIINGITGTWTGTGASRTFTASSGTPFNGLVGNADRILAPLIETPNQTGWVTNVVSDTVVTVTITDVGYVNESNVSLNAIYYYLFSDACGDMTGTTPVLYPATTVQPAFTGLNDTDRIVLALFAYTNQGGSRNISLYYGGTENYSHFEFPGTPTKLSGIIEIEGNASTPAGIKLYEDTDNGTNSVTLISPTDVGTDKIITLPNATGTVALTTDIPASPTRDSLGLDTDDSPQFAGINLGHASDTTLARVSAGVVSIEGVNIVTESATQTLSNKTITGSLHIAGTSSAPASITLAEDTDNGTHKVTISAPASLAGDYTLTLPADDGTSGQFLKTDGSGALSWDTPAGGAMTTAQWVSVTGTYASTTTFTYAGTAAEAESIERCLFTCLSSADARKIGYIKSASESGGTITVTVVSDIDLASGDKTFKIAPHRKIEDYQYFITIPGEQVADASNPQGMYYRSLVDTYLLPVNSFVRTAAAGAGAACAWNVYKTTTNLFSSAQDMTTNATYDEKRPDTKTVSAGDIITLRVTASAGATNKASDLQVQLFLVPQTLFTTAA